MASMEIIPASNDGSISYFNPATKRFHDPVTKRMVPTPAMYKAGKGNTLKQEETTPTPMNPLDSMMEIFREMRDNLKQLVAQGKQSVGIDKKELAISKKELAADKFEAGRESIGDADTDIPPPLLDEEGKGGGFLEGIKGAFGKLSAPSLGTKAKLLLLAAGLYGLTKFSDIIVKTLAPMLEWVDTTVRSLRKTYKEEGFAGLKDEFIDLVVIPSLAPLGLTYTKEGGIDRIKGSWLDVLDPFTGPTNIFNTIGSLFQGKNPDTGEYFLPEWMVKPIVEFEWYKKLDKIMKKDYATPTFEALKGLFKGEWNGESFMPDWYYKPINEMDWYKDTVDFAKTMVNDPKGTLKSLWEGKDPVTGESFLPEWMTKPLSEMEWFKDTVKFYDDFVASDFGQTVGIPTSEEINTAIKNLTNMIYNPETGAVFGMNLDDMKNLLPKLQDIVDKIISSLPKFMRPDTVFEKIADTQDDIIDKKQQILDEKADIEANTFASVGYSNKDNIAKLARLELELIELQDKEIELKSSVFGYNKPVTSLSPQDMGAEFNTMGIKTKNLKAAAAESTTIEYGNTVPAPIAIQANQGPTVVGNTNSISMPKGASHIDAVSIMSFNAGAFLANGAKLN